MPQQDYARKARILRRIMSGKAARYRFYNGIINVFTVIVAGFVTFVSFFGSERLHDVMKLNFGITFNLDAFELLFSIFTFLLLVLIFLQLFFRYSDKQREAETAIVELSTFVNFVVDRVSDLENGQDIQADSKIEVIREKYKSIIASIPSNTDAEYKAAREGEKHLVDHNVTIGLDILGSKIEERNALISVIEGRKDLMEILRSLREFREELWIGGGVFRNAVWDYLHGYNAWTPIDDIDVVYFDPMHTDESFDLKLQSNLIDIHPAQCWSVKNQARMHLHNKEEKYQNLEDAISKWPETCTSFCVRVNPKGDIQIIRPHELTDLFSFIVRPTPNFEKRLDRIESRVNDKRWLHKWPRLRLFL